MTLEQDLTPCRRQRWSNLQGTCALMNVAACKLEVWELAWASKQLRRQIARQSLHMHLDTHASSARGGRWLQSGEQRKIKSWKRRGPNSDLTVHGTAVRALAVVGVFVEYFVDNTLPGSQLSELALQIAICADILFAARQLIGAEVRFVADAALRTRTCRLIVNVACRPATCHLF
jgi:hypothetical protein